MEEVLFLFLFLLLPSYFLFLSWEVHLADEISGYRICGPLCECRTKKVICQENSKARLQYSSFTQPPRFQKEYEFAFRGIFMAVILYDITNRETFLGVDDCAKVIQEKILKPLTFVVVGSKSDLTKKRVVSQDEGKEKARKLGAYFAEVSSVSNSNVNYLFDELIPSLIPYFPKVQRKRNSMQLFLLVILLSDSHFSISDLPSLGHRLLLQLLEYIVPPTKQEIKKRQAERFFHINLKLPMELQMILCNRTYQNANDGILTFDVEQQIWYFISQGLL